MLVHLCVLIPDTEAVPYGWDHIGSISLRVFQVSYTFLRLGSQNVLTIEEAGTV